RGARVPLVVLDYSVGAGATTLLCVLSLSHRLSEPALLVIVAVASLTQPLSNAGLRSVFPLIVPRPLWDRANAVDSGTFVVATVIGPGLGGALVALLGARYAILVPAVALLAGAALIVGVPVPQSEATTTPLLRDAWDALAYVLHNLALRTILITVTIYNLSFGIVSVALPVLVARRLHAGSATTGVLFAALG